MGAGARAAAEVDLLVTSGGLGPTHDDRTVPAMAGRPAWSSSWTRRCWRRSRSGRTAGRSARRARPRRFERATASRPWCPRAAEVIGLAGTAPGLVMPVGAAFAVILPGVPSELRRLWQDGPRDAVAAQSCSRAPEAAGAAVPAHVRDRRVARRRPVRGCRGRLSGRRDQHLRAQLRDRDRHPLRAGGGAAAAAGPGGGHAASGWATTCSRRTSGRWRSSCWSSVAPAGWRLATAESCTGGRVAAALTAIPGASDGVRGRRGQLLERAEDGAAGRVRATCSPATEQSARRWPREMADGARERLGADVAVSVTGVAGPGGGTPEKPVGLVLPPRLVSGRGDAAGGWSGRAERGAGADPRDGRCTAPGARACCGSFRDRAALNCVRPRL